MAVKLGSGSITLRLGDATYPTKAYLGDTLVAATVPGAPYLASINDLGGTVSVAGTIPSDDGGSAITSYEWEVDGEIVTPTTESYSPSISVTFAAEIAGSDHRVRAVNAVGAGPYSNIRTV